MADYKRMVSYMYQYENGVKKKNIGYVRIESKNGQCKFTLHMQLLGQLDSIFPVYLIQRDDNEMNLIYLGDSVLKNQVMDSKLSSTDTNIMGSGYNLSDMGGMLLFLSEKVFFATEWDDRPITSEQVIKAMKPKTPKTNPPEEKREPPMREQPDGKRIAGEENGSKKKETDQNFVGKEVSFQSAVKTDQIYEEDMIPKYKLPRGMKIIERLQNPEVADKSKSPEEILQEEEKRVSKILADAKQENQDRSANQFKSTGDVIQAGAAFAAGEMEAAGLDTSVEAPYSDMTGGEYRDTGSENQDTGEACGYADEGKELPDPPMAARFFDNYPRIYPFEDNIITLCVKIEPKDIGYLSKEAWALSNNSFLLHGFYSYQHLIFAKINDRCGSQYILGVPGIYHNREKFMAKMFGFDNFKSIRKRDLRQGDFGYWYIVIPV